MVAAIEGHENLDQNVERWAREVKGTRGTMRYQRVADALVEKRMPRPRGSIEGPGAEERERYFRMWTAARERVASTLKDVLQGEHDVDQISKLVEHSVREETEMLARQRAHRAGLPG